MCACVCVCVCEYIYINIWYTAGARIIERSQEYKSTVKYRTFVLLRVPIPRGVGKFIAADWNLEPDFGNLPYPEKVTGTNRSDLGKIDKIYDIFTFCETVHRNQNLEPLPKMARREPKMTTLSQFFTRKVPVKLAK